MLRRTVLAAAAAAMLTAASPALLAAPSREVVPYEVSGLKSSAKEIHEAILKAVPMRKWGVCSDEPGKVTVIYPTNTRAKQYQAVVSVTYADGYFKVDYVSSRGLNEERGCKDNPNAVCVHRNVNRWIANLGKDIVNLLSMP